MNYYQILELQAKLQMEVYEERQKELDAETDPDRKLRLREMWSQEDSADKIARAINRIPTRGLF